MFKKFYGQNSFLKNSVHSKLFVKNTQHNKIISIENLKKRYLEASNNKDLKLINNDLTILWRQLSFIINESQLQHSINTTHIDVTFKWVKDDENQHNTLHLMLIYKSNASSTDSNLENLIHFFKNHGIKAVLKKKYYSVQLSSNGVHKSQNQYRPFLLINLNNDKNLVNLDNLIKADLPKNKKNIIDTSDDETKPLIKKNNVGIVYFIKNVFSPTPEPNIDMYEDDMTLDNTNNSKKSQQTIGGIYSLFSCATNNLLLRQLFKNTSVSNADYSKDTRRKDDGYQSTNRFDI